MLTSGIKDADAAKPRSRARFYAPEKAFDRPVPKVPGHVFHEERALAFAPDAPTGLIDLDQAAALDSPWPATTPTMLARYVVLRAGDGLSHRLVSTGEVYYALRGSGTTRCADETIAWREGDALCVPGGHLVRHESDTGGMLMQFTNEPELAYLRAQPADKKVDIKPTLFAVEETDERLRAVHGRNGENQAAGKSVIFLTQAMEHRRVTTPTLLSSINTLEAGGDQRAHRHSSAALTLAIASEGVYSMLDGERIDWSPDTLFVTPPNAVHSHHNRGSTMMRSFVVQDTALHTQLRTTNFAWTE